MSTKTDYGKALLEGFEYLLSNYADVFVIGPLMFWGGMKLRGKHPKRGTMLALLGGATILYNGRNYLRLRKKRSR